MPVGAERDAYRYGRCPALGRVVTHATDLPVIALCMRGESDMAEEEGNTLDYTGPVHLD